MKFLVVSHHGSDIVPSEEQESNSRHWGEWMGMLNEQSGLRIKGGRTVGSTGVRDYAGDSAGVSIIDAPSLEEAIDRVKACPGLPYGWAFDVLHE